MDAGQGGGSWDFIVLVTSIGWYGNLEILGLGISDLGLNKTKYFVLQLHESKYNALFLSWRSLEDCLKTLNSSNDHRMLFLCMYIY